MNLTNTSLVLLIGACNLTWADQSSVELAPLTVEGCLDYMGAPRTFGVAVDTQF